MKLQNKVATETCEPETPMPSPRPATTTQTLPGRGVGLARRAWLPRTIGLGLGGLCVGAALLQHGAPPWLWGLLACNALLWSHVAYAVAAHSRTPFEAEHRNLLIDSALGGFWLPAIGFNVLPSTLLVTMLTLNNVVVGGRRLGLRGAQMQLGGIAVGWTLLGLSPEPMATLPTLLACLPFLVVYPLTIGAMTHRLSRQLAEQKGEVERSERLHRTTLEALEAGIVLFDADGKLVLCNRDFRELYGALGDALQPGMRFEDLLRDAVDRGLIPEAADRPEEWIRERLQQHARPNAAVPRELPGDRWRRIVERRLPDGSLLAFSTDVSDLVHKERALEAARREAQQATEALRRAKGTLERALEAMSDGFLLCDSEDRVVAWNPRYVEMFPSLRDVIDVGVPFERLVEAGAYAVLPDGDDARRAAWRAARLAQHRSGDAAPEITLADGRVIHAVDRRTPEGGIVSVMRDITARERALERAKAAAEASSVAKSQFLAAMSHEMRTPLAGVLGINQLLRATPLSEQQLEHVRIIEASGNALLVLIDDILDMARIETGRMQIDCADFDFHSLIDEALASVRGAAHDKGLTLTALVSPELPAALRGDPRRLRQVLLILLGNAVKFTERGGVVVEVGSRSLEDGRVEIDMAVCDSGIGIAPEARSQLFQRFTQADAGFDRRYGGSGLGLAIGHELIVLMGGKVTVDSAPGRGSTFRVLLPMLPGDRSGVQSTTARPRMPVGARRGARILLAEDNEVNQLVIRELVGQLGHHCDIAADGLQALEMLQEDRGYDLVLMDIQMPRLDGIAAARAIRALPGPYLPIVAVTANTMPEERDAYVAAGMDGHVAKPVLPEQLGAAIDRALRRGREAP